MALAALWFAASIAPVSAFDAHAGYYYPEVQTQEVYVSELGLAPDTGKRSRAAFVTAT